MGAKGGWGKDGGKYRSIEEQTPYEAKDGRVRDTNTKGRQKTDVVISKKLPQLFSLANLYD